MDRVGIPPPWAGTHSTKPGYIQPGLEHCQEWRVHKPSGQLFQSLTTPRVKNFFLISINLLSFSLGPFSLVLSLHALGKCPSPSLSQAPFRSRKVPQGLLRAFSRLNNPNSLNCLHKRGAPALGSTQWPPLGLFQQLSTFPLLGNRNAPGGLSQEQGCTAHLAAVQKGAAEGYKAQDLAQMVTMLLLLCFCVSPRCAAISADVCHPQLGRAG